MPLTVKEKDHWRSRIARRIDHAIEELKTRVDPGFQKRIGEVAEKLAWTSLGLDDLRTENERIQSETKRLSERQSVARQEMESIVTGKPVTECHGQYTAQHSVRSAVDRRAKVYERELLKTTTLGKKIQHRLHEKDELLDTEWLATSPTQIKELWSRFAEVLHLEPPELQQKALEIPPISDDT